MRFYFLLIGLCFALVTSATAEPLALKPPKHGGVYVVAHRGAHNGIPENTLTAYQKAIDLGCDFVEIDIRTTKDNQFVSVHNQSIDAYAPGKKGHVVDMTLAELKALDIGERLGPEWKGTRIPTFDEILDLCKGRIGIYLDLKAGPIPQLAEAVKAHGMETDVLWYIDDRQIPDLKEACQTCIPMPDPGPEKGLADLLTNYHPPVVASVWKVYSKSFVEACHKSGAIVIVDDGGPQTWADILAWGSDGIQTDSPADLIALLKAR